MHIVLYKPDIPQNTAAIIRLSACLNLKVHIIEPCGFNLNDKRFRRVVMDYIGLSKVFRYDSYKTFLIKNKNSRIVLITKKEKKFNKNFKFKKKNMILFERNTPSYISKFKFFDYAEDEVARSFKKNLLQELKKSK